MKSAGAGMEDATWKVRLHRKKYFLWCLRASRISFGREVRAVSSAVGVNVTKMV